MALAKLFSQSILWKSLFFITAFVLNILIARHYEAAISGQIFYLINYYALIILISSLSLEAAIGYFVSKNEISISKFLNFSLLWTALIAIVLALFIFFNKKTYQNIDLLAIVFICGNLLSTFCSAISYAKRKFFLPNLINSSVNILLIILISVIHFGNIKIVTNEQFITLFFISMLIQGTVSLITLISIYFREWSFSLPSAKEFKLLFRYSFMAFFANMIFFLLYRIDYWFVKEFCTAEDLGNYIQVSKLAHVFFILPGIIAGIVFPLTAGGDEKKIHKILPSISRLILMIYTFTCTMLVIIGYWFFPFLFGSSFSNMYIPFLLLIPGILGLSTLYTLTAYFAGKNKIKINIIGALIALIFIITADLIFIPKYGTNAAAFISSLGYIIYHIYVLTRFTKEYGTSAISFFNFSFSDVILLKKAMINK